VSARWVPQNPGVFIVVLKPIDCGWNGGEASKRKRSYIGPFAFRSDAEQYAADIRWGNSCWKSAIRELADGSAVDAHTAPLATEAESDAYHRGFQDGARFVRPHGG